MLRSYWQGCRISKYLLVMQCIQLFLWGTHKLCKVFWMHSSNVAVTAIPNTRKQNHLAKEVLVKTFDNNVNMKKK